MDSILELRPLLLRVFNEVEELHTRLKERDSMIKQLENTVNQLTKENNIYRKVVRMYDGISGVSNNTVSSEENIEENSTETANVQHAEGAKTQPAEVVEEVKTEKKIDLSKKGKTLEELASNRREYHREYRRRRREGRK
jgi:hypothetical protein